MTILVLAMLEMLHPALVTSATIPAYAQGILLFPTESDLTESVSPEV